MLEKKFNIPSFYLYGEAPQQVDHHFLHLEDIAERSAPVQGHIRPHRHGALNHFFLVMHGSGTILHEGKETPFAAPCIFFVPAGVVHGFAFAPDIKGFILTVATSFLAEMARDDLGGFGESVRLWAIHDRPQVRALRLWLMRLARELVWQAPARRAAIEANLLGFFADVQRLAESSPTAAHAAAPHRLLARFRREVEAGFKDRRDLTTYLHALKATDAQLRYACQCAGEKPPAQMILDRRLLEAKRLLLYTNMTISECALASGFDDAAYFSRLFSQATGQSPRAFRTLISPIVPDSNVLSKADVGRPTA